MVVGEVLAFTQGVFLQCFCVSVTSKEEAEKVILESISPDAQITVKDGERFIYKLPYAYRITTTTPDPIAQSGSGVNTNASEILEGGDDCGCFGTSSKLLFLLQRHGVSNVLLCSCRSEEKAVLVEASIFGGVRKFKVIVEASKKVLNEYKNGQEVINIEERERADSEELLQTMLAEQLELEEQLARNRSTSSLLAATNKEKGKSGLIRDRTPQWGIGGIARSNTSGGGEEMKEERKGMVPAFEVFEPVKKDLSESVSFPMSTKNEKRGRVNHFSAPSPRLVETLREEVRRTAAKHNEPQSCDTYSEYEYEEESNNGKHYIPAPILTKVQLRELKTILRPIPEVLTIFQCVQLLTHSKGKKAPLAWYDCKESILPSQKTRAFDLLLINQIERERLQIVARKLQEELGLVNSFDVEMSSLPRKSEVAMKYAKWLFLILEEEGQNIVTTKNSSQSHGGLPKARETLKLGVGFSSRMMPPPASVEDDISLLSIGRN
jgi:hypothetical protein